MRVVGFNLLPLRIDRYKSGIDILIFHREYFLNNNLGFRSTELIKPEGVSFKFQPALLQFT